MSGSQVISLANGTNLVLNVLNARLVRVSPLFKGAEKIDKKGDIIELDYDDIKYTLNQEFNVGKSKYKLSQIKKIEDVNIGKGYYLFSYIINKASMFITPLLALKNEIRTNFRWDTDFCNCFIGTEEDADYGDFIYLLYRYKGTKEFEAFENYLKKHPWFVSSCDPDNHHVMFQFKPDRFFIEDFKLIIQGKYSLISDITKQRILNFHLSSVNNPLGKILYKSPDLKKELEERLSLERGSNVTIPKELDLYDIFNPEEEIYLNKYKIKKEIKNDGDTKYFC